MLEKIRGLKKNAKECFVFIDFSSAYNTVKRSRLWEILRTKEILEENEIEFMRLLTDKLYFSCDKEHYYYINGVPQGMATSPACFDIYMEEFLYEVQKKLPETFNF